TVSNPAAGDLIDYINVESALLIISGIGLSVIVAFSVGALVQFLSRLLFTFQQERHTRGIRIAWSAIAFTVLSYFLVIKGLKGASFITKEDLAYLYENVVWLTLVAMAFWAVVMAVLDRFNVDLLAFVVLAGTFSLAMAFASNDLVNFVGVPLAGLSSWEAWSGSGVDPATFTMESLTEPVQGNTLLLVGAGAIMVATLWLSSKARSVTKTEVDLARQDDGTERFRPGPLSRGLVRAALTTGEAAIQRVPEQWRTELADRFAREKVRTFDLDQPAFDKLRASVNLTVASILIVFATSLKLPLSTTFVSFMVAMGTSLADRAWGRDSAVYRIAGVFSVLGGWLFTAAAAFLMAAAFASLLKLYETTALVGLAALVIVALVHSHRYHARQSRMQQLMLSASPDAMDQDALTLRRHFVTSLQRNADVLNSVIKLLLKRNRKSVKKLRKLLQADSTATRRTEAEFVGRLNQVKPQIEPWLMNQLDVLACERDLLQSATTLVELAGEHVLNEHSPPTDTVSEGLVRLRELFRICFADLAGSEAQEIGSSPPIGDIERELDALTTHILEDMYSGERSTRNTTILLGIVLEMRDLQRQLQRAEAWQI
ncbi:MAG: hypothetical protein AAFN78_16370, partial [Pseudomonadota bacterium]